MIQNKYGIEHDTLNQVRQELLKYQITCPSCNSHLNPSWLNEKEIILMCTNKYVSIHIN
jgi:hypothetical protein